MRLEPAAEIQSVAMLFIAGLGLAANFYLIRVLASDRSKNLNMRGAYLELGGIFGIARGDLVVSLITISPSGRRVDSVVAIAMGFFLLAPGICWGRS